MKTEHEKCRKVFVLLLSSPLFSSPIQAEYMVFSSQEPILRLCLCSCGRHTMEVDDQPRTHQRNCTFWSIGFVSNITDESERSFATRNLVQSCPIVKTSLSNTHNAVKECSDDTAEPDGKYKPNDKQRKRAGDAI